MKNYTYLKLPASLILMVAFATATLYPTVSEANDKPVQARLMIQWTPQAQFAGYLVAEEKGFYQELGIDLKILSGGPDILASEFLEAGKVDFVTMFLATGIKKRASGVKVVNIAQFVQKSALMLIAKADSGINTIKDLDGEKVGLWANEFQLQPLALFNHQDISVDIIPQSSSLDLFLRDGVKAASGMWYNEYHALISAGLNAEELNIFFYHDFDLNFPEDGLYCLQKTLDDKPDLCRNVVLGTIKGWEYSFAHPEEALEIVMTRMQRELLPTNLSHQRWMLSRMKDIIRPEGLDRPMGSLSKDDFMKVGTVLTSSGLMKEIPDMKTFHRDLANEK